MEPASVVTVPEYLPSASPCGFSTLKTNDVPLIAPAIDAVWKHGELVDVMVPDSVAVLAPVFGP